MTSLQQARLRQYSRARDNVDLKENEQFQRKRPCLISLAFDPNKTAWLRRHSHDKIEFQTELVDNREIRDGRDEKLSAISIGIASADAAQVK